MAQRLSETAGNPARRRPARGRGVLGPGPGAGGFGPRLAWDPGDRRRREVIGLLVPTGLAVGVLDAGGIADTAVGSTAPEAAGRPALHDAWLPVGLPIALLGQAVGPSAFPRLAAHAAAAEWRALRRTLLRSLAAALALCAPTLLGLVFLGRLAIRRDRHGGPSTRDRSDAGPAGASSGR